MKARYSVNKSAKVGDNLVCPSCGTSFVKSNYQQAFCKSKSGTFCKDYFWNNVTPNKRNNTARISPANQSWKDKQEERRMWNESDDHPFSSEGLGQWCD